MRKRRSVSISCTIGEPSSKFNQSDIMVDSFAPKVFDGYAKRLQTRRACHSDPRHHFLHREVAERLLSLIHI